MSVDLSQQVPHVRHELRTPISAILGYSELLLEEHQNSGDQNGENAPLINNLIKIRTCGQQLLLLINNALDKERIQADAVDWDKEIFSDVAQLELRIFLDAVLGYCDWLEPKVQSRLKPDIEQIRCGAHQLLTLVDKIIQGGLTQVIQPVQAGAISNQKAPAANSSPQPEPEDFQPLPTPERPGHLLVVDDNETNRDLLSRQLSRQGYQIEIAISGEQALAKLASYSYDLILLEL